MATRTFTERLPIAAPDPSRPAARTAAGSSGIEARGLVKSFSTAHGVIRAVRGVDLTIDPGATVALLGPNGAGKSTTIDMLLGLVRPDGGTVRLFGSDPVTAVAAGQVGAMLQTGGLLGGLTVRELIDMAASLYPAPLAVEHVLQIAGLSEIAEHRTEKLSGGQAQRMRFALALASDARFLVLDEPTVGMDVEGRRDFWETIRAAAGGGKAVLFATHYLEEADAYADRIVLMAHGTVVADGPATELRARVGGRRIRVTLPDAELAQLRKLAGVSGVERHGEAVVLSCHDADEAARALFAAYPQARDLEVAGAGLEEAFLELTTDQTSVH